MVLEPLSKIIWGNYLVLGISCVFFLFSFKVQMKDSTLHEFLEQFLEILLFFYFDVNFKQLFKFLSERNENSCFGLLVFLPPNILIFFFLSSNTWEIVEIKPKLAEIGFVDSNSLLGGPVQGGTCCPVRNLDSFEFCDTKVYSMTLKKQEDLWFVLLSFRVRICIFG